MRLGLILNNLRSVYNVGSIFRTADAVGVEFIYLVGTTPTPTDRFGRKRKDLTKVALGAEDTITWKYFESFIDAVNSIKVEGFEIVGIEQNRNSVLIEKFVIKKNVALVLGEETLGISERDLNECDRIVEIPMFGVKESLNVAVAAGVALYFIKLNN